MRRYHIKALLCLMLLVSTASISQASFMTSFSANAGPYSASVTFTELSATTLGVQLRNTSLNDVLTPAGALDGGILTGVFFSINGRPMLSTVGASALVSTLPSSSVSKGVVPVSGPGTNVGGEFAYGFGLAGPGGATQGISSSGLGLFGSGNLNGLDLAGPPSGAVDGLQYGITSQGDNLATGNANILGNELIKYSVDFVLTGWTSFSGTDAGFRALFTNISFQYGTDLSEPNVPVPPDRGPNPVPVPSGVILMGLGGLLISAYTYRNRRRSLKLA